MEIKICFYSIVSRFKNEKCIVKLCIVHETGYNSGRSSPCSSTTLSPEASMCEVQTVLMHGDRIFRGAAARGVVAVKGVERDNPHRPLGEEQTPADAFAPQTAGTEAEEADEDADETLKPSDVADQLEASVEAEEEEEEASAEVTLTEDGQDKAWEETLQHHRDFLNKVSSQLLERPTSVHTDGSITCGIKDTGALTDHRLELSEEQLQEDVQAVLRSLDEALVAHGLEDDSAKEEEEKKAPEENRVKEHFADKLMNQTNEHAIGKENRLQKEVFQKDDYSSEPLANPIQREKKRVRFNVDFQDTEGKKRKEVALRRKRRTKIPCRNSFYNTDGYESDDDQYYQFSWSLQNASPRNVKYQVTS
ncbi:Protein of unknown function [Gryllus bimaculatus]|nr:Protein of unknown function [Gryllus bimaculatus]